MKPVSLFVIVTPLILLMMPLSIHAQSAAPSMRQEEISRSLKILQSTRPNDRSAAILLRLLGKFRALDVDGVPGLSDEDTEIAAQTGMANSRARMASNFFRYDYDGDFTVTAEELKIAARQYAKRPLKSGANMVLPTQEQIALLMQDFLDKQLKSDHDNDGQLSLDDIRVATGSRDTLDHHYKSATQTGFDQVFDLNDDGRITEIELRKTLEQVLKQLDANRNGTISDEEIRALRHRITIANNELRKAGQGSSNLRRGKCQLPEIPKGAQVFVFHSSQGSALTDLVFEKEKAAPVTLAYLSVPPGKKDIYVLASFATPVILKLVGDEAAVTRVKHVSALNKPVGVIGGQVVQTKNRCIIGFLGIANTSAPALEKQFKAALRIKDVKAFDDRMIGLLDLALGTNNTKTLLEGHATPKGSPDTSFLTKKLLRYNPGGFHRIDPESVTSARPVWVREIWPQEAGLLQLLESGAIVLDESNHGERVFRRIAPNDPVAETLKTRPGANIPGKVLHHEGMYYERQPDGSWLGTKRPAFIVTTGIKIPAGLNNGAHAVLLVVPDGVERPRGVLDRVRN